MYKPKHLKPNLIDSTLRDKIIKTLNPPKEDYWAPTKTSVKSIFEKYIKPNYLFFLIILVLIFFLIYRYRIVKADREKAEMEKYYKSIQDTNSLPPSSQVEQLDTASILLHLYNLQKENMREPPLAKKDNNLQTEPNFAYPMYPYTKGGTLASSNRK